jgi:hypothetical protein
MRRRSVEGILIGSVRPFRDKTGCTARTARAIMRPVTVGPAVPVSEGSKLFSRDATENTSTRFRCDTHRTLHAQSRGTIVYA